MITPLPGHSHSMGLQQSSSSLQLHFCYYYVFQKRWSSDDMASLISLRFRKLPQNQHRRRTTSQVINITFPRYSYEIAPCSLLYPFIVVISCFCHVIIKFDYDRHIKPQANLGTDVNQSRSGLLNVRVNIFRKMFITQ